MNADGGVTLDVRDDVAVATIDRPQVRNAIGFATMDALARVVADVSASPARVLVLTGAGDRVFASGGDLKELATIRTADDAAAMARRMRDVCDGIATLPIPVVAAVNGAAFGGGAELAVAADIRIAAAGVVLAFNQVALAIMPAWGGLERLRALVGPARALYLATSGTRIAAEQACAWGLVEEVVPREEFADRWSALARQIASAPRSVLGSIKATAAAPHAAPTPAMAEAAIDRFARTWVADDHWAAVDRMDSERRARSAS
jgi:enoyl-CoA hydratase